MEKIYKKETDQIVQDFETDAMNGLSTEEAAKRLEKYGPNELDSSEEVSLIKIILQNLNSVIVYLLLGASILSFLMNDPVEGVAVLIAVLIAVVFGVVSEYQAATSVESLLELVTSETVVIREGKRQTIPSSELVPGDLMYLINGNTISADGRIIDSSNFACIESSLTGEAESVEKNADPLTDEESLSIGDRVNCVFSGTAVTRGNAYAIVTATGMKTEIGHISEMMSEGEHSESPLNKELNQLGKLLILFAFVAAILVILIGLIQGNELSSVIQIAIILAISAIPEALPAVSTITLARGMRKMATHQTMVKTLASVETLGSTDVIASDKTGTLTENQMTVERVYLTNEAQYTVSGTGYSTEGTVTNDKEQPVNLEEDEALSEFIHAALLASESELVEKEDVNEIIGDPTDGSVVVLGHKLSLTREKLENATYTLEKKFPFDSEKKYMMNIYQEDDRSHLFIKGALDVLIEQNQSSEENQRLEAINEKIAEEGLRVLAIAKISDYTGEAEEEAIEAHMAEQGLTILGLVGIIDPPRKDVIESVTLTQQAGIKVKMITGDHPKTASVIAKEIGIEGYEQTITGTELDQLLAETPDDFYEKIKDIAVFARVSPENKLQIVEAYQANGLTVAMTGDGVNDAPALKGANIGVAMGIRGTEVAKDASDMILMDDRFTSIVEAIKEGRIIFSNIKKFVYFLFTCNMIELISIFLALLLVLPLPLNPLHILWLNLVVDSFPALSLAFEPGEGNIMKQAPRNKKERLVNWPFIQKIGLSGLIIGISSFLVFLYFFHHYDQVELAQTAAFTSMGLGQLAHIGNVRKENHFGFSPKNFAENRYLLGALAISFALILSAIYLPGLNDLFHSVPLQPIHWLIIVAQVIATTILVYLAKKVFIKREN